MTPQLFKLYREFRDKGWWAKVALRRAREKIEEQQLVDSFPYSDLMTDTKYGIDYKGSTFEVVVKPEMYADAPWENQATLGEVQHKQLGYPTPKGFVKLAESRYAEWVYDYDGAIKEVLSWGRQYTQKLAETLVQQDMDFLSGWLLDEWIYLTVTVEKIEYCSECGQRRGNTTSLGLVESNSKAYVIDTIYELIEELL